MIEVNRFGSDAGENKYVCHLPGLHRPLSRRYGALRSPAGVEAISNDILSFGRVFAATLTSIKILSGSQNHKPLESKPGGGSSSLTPTLSPLFLSGSISSSKGCEGDVAELFGRSLRQESPSMFIVRAGELHLILLGCQIEPKRFIKILRFPHVRCSEKSQLRLAAMPSRYLYSGPSIRTRETLPSERWKRS